MSTPGARFRGLFWALLALSACVPARRKVAGEIVRSIEFVGNGASFSGHNDLQLRKQLEQETTGRGLLLFPLSVFVEPKLLDRAALVRDAYRLEVWYAHHGWFDARVIGWSSRQVRRQRARAAGVVDLVGIVDPGPPSLVGEIGVTGDTPTTRVLSRAALRTGFTQPGSQFNLELAELDRVALRTQLQQSGYAYARVDLAMDARPAERAVDVTWTLEPGVAARIGPVTITGNDAVKTHLIAQNLRVLEGQPYRLDALTASQNRLFDMGTFDMVSVRPDLSDPTQVDVPITVKVNETKFRSLKFGVQLRLENAQLIQPSVTTRFKHTHLMHQLIGLDLFASAGLSNSPTSGTATGLVPVYRAQGSLTYPRILGQKVAQQIQVDIDRGVQQGLGLYLNPTADVRTIWKPSDVFVLSAGPHVEQFEYLELEDTEPDNPIEIAARRLFGDDELIRVYRITSIDLGMTLDWRDDPLTTKRGSFFQGTLRLAFPVTEKDFAFTALTGDWRLFRPIRVGEQVPLTFATRVQGKALVPVAGSSLPYPELAFFGGSSSMRGFPARGMGPYTTFSVPVADGAGVRRYFVPRGGSVGLVVSEELRYFGPGGITWAGFVDAATLGSPGRSFGDGPELPLSQALIEGFRIAGGVGVRYGSPIGPLRVDLAVRPRYEEDRGPSNPGATDAEKRRIDLIHTFNRRSDFPLAVMLFIAIGEMI